MSCTCTPAAPVVVVDLATLTRLTHLEQLMATATEAIAALTAQADANSTALLDLVADVRALIALLSAEQQLTPETQAAADALAAKLAGDAGVIGALDTEVGDADGSDTPPAP